jgi:large subunit ribosomal protein L30
MAEDVLEITLRRSPIGRPPEHRITLKTLGLTRLHKTVKHRDNAAMQGMIRQVAHLIEVRKSGSTPIHDRQGMDKNEG